MNTLKNLISKFRAKIVRLANEAMANLIGLSNEIGDATAEWIQLTPYGDFPHAQGLQRVNRAAAEAMANHFNGILASAKRAIFGGLPWFEGHPDVPSLANDFPNKKAFGWIKKMEARDDGLYGQVEWNNLGKEVIANKAYKFFSPFWEAKQIGTENSRPVFQPTQLLSVGFTNTPNLPVRPLANDRLAGLANILKLPETATIEEIQAHVQTIANSLADLENAREQFRSERQERITLMLDNAIREKRITIAERPDWQEKLTKNFANAQTELAAKTVANLNTESQTRDLGKDKRTFENERTRQDQITAFVTEKMNAGLSYDQAWALAKRELAAIFEQMGKR